MNYDRVLDLAEASLNQKLHNSYKNIKSGIESNQVNCKVVSLFPLMTDLIKLTNNNEEGSFKRLIEKGFELNKKN